MIQRKNIPDLFLTTPKSNTLNAWFIDIIEMLNINMKCLHIRNLGSMRNLYKAEDLFLFVYNIILKKIIYTAKLKKSSTHIVKTGS
ncbi:hypothetical protein KL86DYS1_31422 [uncultured Dysgonomonas sp.]|uniref:Uncharacterized protein n=1 Tax=uncultured Dysgonomonas sp. TaxID=206096 RepID=A0A212K4S9_9BACT|nr:hypothetical protein KL86DYS1_31422 [uncultured Dysgonomonas sp.]